jgi:hypothetical protein
MGKPQITDMEIMIDLSQGNPGALGVVSSVYKEGRMDVLMSCLTLDIRGPSIWILYKDLGDETLETFYKNVFTEDVKQRLAAVGY